MRRRNVRRLLILIGYCVGCAQFFFCVDFTFDPRVDLSFILHRRSPRVLVGIVHFSFGSGAAFLRDKVSELFIFFDQVPLFLQFCAYFRELPRALLLERGDGVESSRRRQTHALR